MKDFYFEVLQRLYNAGIGVEKEVTDIFSDVANKPWYNKEIQIKDFLEYMKESGHIKYTIGYTGVPDTEILNAEITISGYEYYRNHLLDVATMQSLSAIPSNNSKTWIIAIISIGVLLEWVFTPPTKTQTYNNK